MITAHAAALRYGMLGREYFRQDISDDCFRAPLSRFRDTPPLDAKMPTLESRRITLESLTKAHASSIASRTHGRGDVTSSTSCFSRLRKRPKFLATTD